VKSRHWILVGISLIGGVASTLLFLATASAQPEAAGALSDNLGTWAFVTAAGATATSSIAAAYAVARVGSAAVGALTEKPELFGRMVVLVGLAEGIAIYGLIISILILNQLR
jgi:V/A-type H+-transporting ATPase subunit K